MNKQFSFFLFTVFLIPVSFVHAETVYLDNEYAVVLEQFEEVWVEENYEGCGSEDDPCGYWDWVYGEPVIVKQGEVATLDLNKKTSVGFEVPEPEEDECQLRSDDLELFYINNGERQIIQRNDSGGFSLQEGIYEVDLYIGCIYQVKNDKSIFDTIFAWLKPSIAYAAPYGEYVGTIRFSVTDKNALPLPPLTLQEKAAELAKELVDQPDAYLWGGKGWDYDTGEFVPSIDILSGYTYWNPNKNGSGVGGFDVGIGVDCSGLITWAFNRANDSLKSATHNFVKYVNANGLHADYQSYFIEENDLQPGDAMFFDWGNDNYMDHVAMYVGESSGYDLVNAASIDQGIIATKKDLLAVINGFVGFRRIYDAQIAMSIKSGSPVDLVVSDPSGLTITPDSVIHSDEEYIREIPNVLYYVEMEKAGDGNPVDRVYSPILKHGDYIINILPTENALLTDTYSLEFTIGENTIILAENVPISEIPVAGYYIQVNESKDVESSGEIDSGRLLDKIREYIHSFDASDSFKKPLSAMVDAIEKRVEINHKLQEKLTKHTEKLKENEKAILRELSLAEKIFSEKAGQKMTNKDRKELLVLLTRVLLAFN